MITAERKPLGEIKGFLEKYNRILVVGCGTCVTVCFAGGEQEVKTVSAALRIGFKKDGAEKEIFEGCEVRQCDPEYIDQIIERVKNDKIDAVLSLACGVGVNCLAEHIGAVPVFPGLNTAFYGATVEHGKWAEMCAGCGACILHLTGGICPIARCSKSLQNGPCGGCDNGKCEISPDVDCAWILIIKRMEQLGTLESLDEIQQPHDWSKSTHGGVRTIVREDLLIK
ncbi:MAG: methylenetetrahydrofolate reductase C-terminal domain-containing protein [Desulfobulbaceae bacterium]|nr:methylenetetrahydrofolate reductase C-terminal domain-containing protein [Desulfobulbaceae bacterium]MCK5437280.1 methylenetetrahydrofolate reductase C-terminal domain-containing protein [Desulfobulbaceae bacterium]MCK5544621.1 methylenetetrahydrofolate reductase C-terminal domain-containing protein [Desulfobulbaceae bacterium]